MLWNHIFSVFFATVNAEFCTKMLIKPCATVLAAKQKTLCFTSNFIYL